MVATMTAATFVFCLLVTVRALAGMLSGGRIAIASMLQFTLRQRLALLHRRGSEGIARRPRPARHAPAVTMQSIPDWSPDQLVPRVVRADPELRHGRIRRRRAARAGRDGTPRGRRDPRDDHQLPAAAAARAGAFRVRGPALGRASSARAGAVTSPDAIRSPGRSPSSCW